MSHPIDQSRKADQLDFLKAVVETTDAIVVASSPEAGIIWVNQAFERITGYAEEEAIGRPIWSFRVPEEVESGRRSFQAAARNDGRRFESRWLTKSGKELILSWSTRPVTDDQGNVRFLSLIHI